MAEVIVQQLEEVSEDFVPIPQASVILTSLITAESPGSLPRQRATVSLEHSCPELSRSGNSNFPVRCSSLS